MIVQNQNNLIAQTHENKIIDSEFVNDGGLKFDGVNDYLNVPITTDFRSISFSICCFFKILSLSKYIELFFKVTDPVHNREVDFRITNTGYIELVYNRNGPFNYKFIRSTIQLSSNNTYHLVLVKNGNDINNFNFYLNGILINKSIITNIDATPSLASNAIIGFDISIDYGNFINYDLKIFNKALTAAEVAYLNGNKQLIPSSCSNNCVLDMRFNDKAGTVAKDRSGNNYNGTLTNFANTSLGASNAWVDQYGNSITQY